jgi:hypothetical protein
MTGRYLNLKKVQEQPAARALSLANLKLDIKLPLPAKASIAETFDALENIDDSILDKLRLFSAVLPPREGVWWACLATKDLESVKNSDTVSPILKATERWVFKPNEENLTSVKLMLDSADVDDESALCGTAALFSDGKLGPGDLAGFEAPPGEYANAVFGCMIKSWSEHGETLEDHGNLLIERALDLARGGSGNVTIEKTEPAIDDEDIDDDAEIDDDTEIAGDAEIDDPKVKEGDI